MVKLTKKLGRIFYLAFAALILLLGIQRATQLIQKYLSLHQQYLLFFVVVVYLLYFWRGKSISVPDLPKFFK